MKIGFFGGCFNPPTNVHRDIANELIKNNIVDKVIFVPIGDFYKKQNLANINNRCEMLKISIENHEKLEIDDFEKDIKEAIFAADAFKVICEKYKDDEIYFIMGSDNFLKISTWKDYENIINLYNYIVVKRDKNEIIKTKNNVILYIPYKEYNYDSTTVRKLIREKKNIDNLVNKNVAKFIKNNNLYNI